MYVVKLLIGCHLKGIQAQTVANFYLAFEAQLTIIPVINKVPSDLPLLLSLVRIQLKPEVCIH